MRFYFDMEKTPGFEKLHVHTFGTSMFDKRNQPKKRIFLATFFRNQV